MPEFLFSCEEPLQLPVRKVDVSSEMTTSVDEDEHEPSQVKAEQEEELDPAQPGEGHEEDGAKETMFNIICVQRCEEDGRRSPCGDKPSSSSQQLKAEADKDDCGAAESSSENSDDEWRDTSLNRKKAQRDGETADRLYNCTICDKNFRTKYILNRHMKTHTGDKPHSCDLCGKGFIQRSYLQTHMNSHSGQKPYTCSFCGRGFTQVGNMNAHMRIHTGEKPHSCVECGKSFRKKADLIKHTIIHTGEKPYGCTECAMKFRTQSNLTRHMKTHSGDRPYSCTACEKRFIRRSNLIIHMKTHAGENV